MRINHPAIQGPVSVWRWIKYHVGVWMERKGDKLIDRALFPKRCPECGLPLHFGPCDHIPF